MSLEPLLKHHQHPNHRSVIAGMTVDVSRQLVQELRSYDTRFFRSARLSSAICRSCGYACSHAPKGNPKPCFSGDNLVGQEATQGLLEEIAQPRASELEAGRESGGNATTASLSIGYWMSMPANSHER